MDHKLQKTECPPGDYLIFRQGHTWYVTVLSDGTIFIKLDQKAEQVKLILCSCAFKRYTQMYNSLTECPQCNLKFKCPDKWCSDCEIKNFKSNFGNWTKFIDVKFIAEGGFGCVESAIWNLGPRWTYEPSSRKWERSGPYNVALKTVNDSHQYLQEFLNEVQAHYICTSEDNHIPHCFGITQNPKSKDYIMVLEYAHYGSLRY
ncbi:unnamed protein product [Rhizophagus irregularis]|nr:unnamed protein product [Rhizophagus irregularis]